jgi:uncharacterized protein (TIGR02996 family)
MAKSKPLPDADEPGEAIWQKKRILAFAPDDASIPAAQKVLKKGGFGEVEATADGKGWWVVCTGITDTYQTSVRVSDGEFEGGCTCPSPKYPCKHVLALLLYLLDHPEERAEPEAPRHAATDFEGLVRAVFQNPDDDTPRLVFADYLDENDQPDRAALIRTQCALAREAKTSDRGKELRKEERRLLAALEKQIGTLPEGMRAEFRRGFLHLHANLYSFREVGALPERFTRLFRDGWVEVFRPVSYIYELLDDEHATLLRLVGELDFSDAYMGEDQLVALVAQAADMKATGRLCRVKVAKRHKKVFDELTAAQAGNPGKPASRRVGELRQFRSLTSQSLELLSRAGRLRTARQLVLDGRLRNRDAELLASADLSGVEQLHLIGWQLEPGGVAALAEGLSGLSGLGVRGTRLEPAHVAPLARGGIARNLQGLALPYASLTDAGLHELAGGSPFPRLLSLDLEENSLTTAGILAFLRSPNFPALTSLTLTRNGITAPELLRLVLEAPDRPELTLRFIELTFTRTSHKDGPRLSLSMRMQLRSQLFGQLGAAGKRVSAIRIERAEVVPGGLKGMADALDPATLKDLEFDTATVKNDGAAELAAAFKDYKLQGLRLSNCKIQASGVAALADSPLLDSVKVLDLTGNAVGRAGAAALLKSSHLGSLERLELRAAQVRAEDKKALQAKFGKKLVV